MPADQAAASRAPRLNPFAFPSDTDARFVLLVVAVLGAGVLLYSMLYDTLPLTAGYKHAEYERCVEQARTTYPGESITDLSAQVLLFGDCTTLPDLVQAGWMLGGMALIVAVAIGLYWTAPAWKIRSEHLEPLSAEDAPEVVACLPELCRQAALAAAPTFVWNPLDSARGGLAFGRWGRYYVALTGGLVSQFYIDRDAFRAVVLHELAHLRNSDVDKAYVTVAIWRAFLVAALAPFAVGQLLASPSPLELLDLTWRVIPLAALVWLMRNAVLHAREFDADVRASTWGVREALGRVLAGLPQPGGGSWRFLLSHHPHPRDRRLALDETERLLCMGFWDAFGAGCTAGLALPNIVALLNLIVSTSTLVLASFVPALLVAALTVGVVGVGVWRTTFVALARTETPHGAGRLGLGLGLGLLLGQRLSFADGAFWKYFPSPWSVTPMPDAYQALFEMAWGSVMLASMFFFLRWIAAGASAWLEVSAAQPSPRPVYRLGLAVAGALLAIWLGVLYFIYIGLLSATREASAMFLPLLDALQSSDAATLPAGQENLAASLLSLGNLLALLMVVSLWMLPLAAWFSRGRAVAPAPARWAFLDASSASLRLPPQPRLRPDLALRAGLVGGASFWAASALVFGALWLVRLHPSLGLLLPGSETLGVTDADIMEQWSGLVGLWTGTGQLALAVLLQLGLAAGVAARAPRLGALHGLSAACVAGWLMAAGSIGLSSLFFAVLGSTFWLTDVAIWMTWLFVSAFTTWSPLLLAFPAAAIAATLVTRLRPHPASSRPAPSQPDGTPARQGVALQCF